MLYSVSLRTVNNLMYVLDLLRPPAPDRGPAHTSLSRWNVLVDCHWSGAGLSHPNVLSCGIFLKLRRFFYIFHHYGCAQSRRRAFDRRGEECRSS